MTYPNSNPQLFTQPITQLVTQAFTQKFTHPIAQKLAQIMEQKKSNLALSLDLTEKQSFLKMADLLGPEICILKTHIDVIADFDQDLIFQLQKLAQKHDFLLFEDRKFADIGETVKHQLAHSIFKISDWADLINAHGITGPGIIPSLKSVARADTGLLLIAQLSSKANLITPEITQTMAQWADQHPDFVVGFIAQQKLQTQQDFLYLTPGVHLDKKGDGQDQQYRTPEEAILRDQCDIIIVGRAIYGDLEPTKQAKRYREAGWKAWEARQS
jgi:orotidine 5'-phosphate decarboxylase subfamily 1